MKFKKIFPEYPEAFKTENSEPAILVNPDFYNHVINQEIRDSYKLINISKIAPGHLTPENKPDIKKIIDNIVKDSNLTIECPKFKCYELKKYFEVFKGNTSHGEKFIHKLCSKEKYNTCPYLPENKLNIPDK